MADLYEHMDISSVAAFLHIKIDESSKTQREIAKEIGYDNPNVLSMMKHGETKVPLEKIPAFAKALNVDPGNLLRLGLEQYWPGLRDVIKNVFGHIASENELALLKPVRVAFRDADPAFSETEIEAAVAVLIGLRKPRQA